MDNYDCVGVLGGGSWGTTIAHLLGQNGHKVLLWLRNEDVMAEINEKHRNSRYLQDYAISENVRAVKEIEEVARRCEVIFVVVPAKGFRKVCNELGDYIRGDQILISACKGLETETHSRMTQIIREETCVRKTGVLSGPNLALEIMQDSPSATVIASHYHEVINKGITLLSSKIFKVYGSEDVLGAELGGVVKNVVAIASGIVEGLNFGTNTKSFLMTRGLHEMGRIGVKLGANPMTFTGLAGIGDMIVTCSSKLSRNFRVGYYLAQGKKLPQILEEMNMVAEGVNTTKVLHEVCKHYEMELAIVEGMYSILYNHESINKVIDELMARKSHFEIDNTLMRHHF